MRRNGSLTVTEPFVHPSHPLYYIPSDKDGICSGCNKRSDRVLKCIEVGCGFILDFKCATLPQVVEHRVDKHPLSLCYGRKKASDGDLCNILCESKIEDAANTSYEVVLNNSVSS